MDNRRVIALIDMDCFYVQVEERDNPSIKGKPAAVVQYNSYKGGTLLAVNYEARKKGIRRDRSMRGDDALVACPEIILVKVPELRGKADLTKYRNAGQEVIQVLCEMCKTVERASVDEAYLDLTELVETKLQASNDSSLINSLTVMKNINRDYLQECYLPQRRNEEDNVQDQDSSSVKWLDELIQSEMADIHDVKLILGAEIVGQMRKAIYDKTSFRCSAGIAHNKVLAKLGCGINKPNKQTIIPQSFVPDVYRKTKVHNLRNFGGKLGDILVQKFNCNMMSDLLQFSEKELSSGLGAKCGSWVYHVARGLDDEVVTSRQLPKSVGCNKMFNGPEALKTKDRIKHWLEQLSGEVVERLQKDLDTNKRRAKSLTLITKFDSQDMGHISKTFGTHIHYDAAKMAADAMSIMDKLLESNGSRPVVNLGLIASKFEDEDDISKCSKINTFFKTVDKPNLPKENNELPSTSKALIGPKRTPDLIDIENVIENSNSNSVDQPKGFFNRNPSPKKKIPKMLTFSSLKSQSPKKSDAEQSNSNHSKPESKSAVISKTSSGNTTTIVSNNNTSTDSNSKIPSAETSEPITKAFSQECERCHKSFPVWDLPCHMDWHMARDLQREMNAELAAPISPIATRSKSPNKSSKRPATKSEKSKSKRGRPADKSNNGMKTLDNYFIQKSSM